MKLWYVKVGVGLQLLRVVGVVWVAAGMVLRQASRCLPSQLTLSTPELPHHTSSTPPTMKLSWSFVLSSLYCSAAASRSGHVFLFDPSADSTSNTQQPPSVSPHTARLILAQRLGLSRFHSLKDADDETIDRINTYGGKPQISLGGSKLGKTTPRNDAHLLVWLEDAEDARGP
jgi:hypothetical protein